jgi:uncharacterized repeat protein (TIGR03803 family)
MESSQLFRSRSTFAAYLTAAIIAISFVTAAGAPARAAFATVHSFFGSPADGAEPFGTVIEDPITGNFYGTTATGGTHGLGIVYCMNPGFGITILHNFAGPDGATPTCTLVLGAAPATGAPATIYGTTLRGGKFDEGVVFKISVTGAPYVKLHNFGSTAIDGTNPWAGVIIASNGRLYGTTFLGGKFGQGTTYEITTAGGGYATTHDFMGLSVAGVPPDGSHPIARLFEFAPGFLVGTTYDGGQADFGTVFTEKLGGGGYALAHQFLNVPDGAHPMSELISIISPSGGPVLWGTTSDGGALAMGTIYSLAPSGAPYADEYDFHGGPDGAYPYGAVNYVVATGNIYGTTQDGGPTGNGVVYVAFPIGPTPIPEGVVHPFGIGDGQHPLSALYLNLAGTQLFGSARDGGAGFDGTLFFQTP